MIEIHSAPIGTSLPEVRARARARLPGRIRGLVVSAVAVLGGAASACGGSVPDARYPAREAGCAVKAFPGESELPLDELGTVTVACVSGEGTCQRQLLDAVCRRGGDVAWGVADNTLNATTLVAHAGHTHRAVQRSRASGCDVQVFTDAPSIRTENVGPVTASCAADDGSSVCLRELEDQVCLLGGDVLWQVDGPTLHGNKQRMHGRAAHTK